MHKILGLSISAAAIIATGLTPAAGWAATTSAAANGPGAGDPATTITFTISTGALSMTAPTSVNLGSGAAGGTVSGGLGLVTVTDNRALLSAAWTVTASSTNFTTGTATSAETIPAGDVSYNPGTINTTGTITTTGTTVALSNSAQTVVAGTAGVGNNSASWTPLITVAVPAAAVGGVYTGTLSQSVA